MASAPYCGPAWYWVESYRYIIEVCWSEKGKITPEDVVCVFTTTDHAPADSLKIVYSQIERTIGEALRDTDGFYSPPIHTDEIDKCMKLMMLSMQGAWLMRSASTWNVTKSSSAADAEGPVHRTRKDPIDGTTLWMSRKRHLGNHTMFLIGLVSLHNEHLIIAQLRRTVKKALGIQPNGGCVDCLFYKNKDKEKIIPVIKGLTYPDDGSQIWKIETPKKIPDCPLATMEFVQTKSIWRSHDNDEHGLAPRFGETAFGGWSSEKRFTYKREWRVLTESPGIGRGEDDDYQEDAAQALADNNGGCCIGRGGSGKSHILKRLRAILEERGVKVHVCAFTHVAAQNCEGKTILHTLHAYLKAKKTAILIDKMSMIPLKMWTAIAQMQMTGNTFYIFGDCAGQFLPIQDQHRHALLTDLDRSYFIHSLTNGLRVEVNKYRRGGDMGHYNFVGSIYGKSLAGAIQEARARYLKRGPFNGTTICISHISRERINEEVNSRIAPMDHLVIKAEEKPCAEANRPQDMRAWVGIVLVAVGTHGALKNGLRYKLLTLPE
jgi:hypothetical protein